MRADPSQLEQVILNLAVNARDAMPDGGTLTIETADATLDEVRAHVPAATTPCMLLTVRDTGHGMDEETRSRIFEPFFTTKEQGKGTGLGLATVYGVVVQSGGHIVVESTPGKGTSFLVFLPRVAEPTAAPEATPASPPPGGGATVLLVEDEDIVRGLVLHILKTAGYHVLVAADGDAALQVSADHCGPIALLLTDVVMPRMRGPELAALLERTRPDMKVLYMSGYTGSAIDPALSDDSRFMSKPFTPRDLLAKVKDVLAER